MLQTSCNQIYQIDHIFVAETRLSGLTPPPLENHSLTSPDISVLLGCFLGWFCVWCVWLSWWALLQFFLLPPFVLWALGAAVSSLLEEWHSCWRGMMTVTAARAHVGTYVPTGKKNTSWTYLHFSAAVTRVARADSLRRLHWLLFTSSSSSCFYTLSADTHVFLWNSIPWKMIECFFPLQ